MNTWSYVLGELELETIVAGSSDGILLGSSLSQSESESESEMRDRIICVNRGNARILFLVPFFIWLVFQGRK